MIFPTLADALREIENLWEFEGDPQSQDADTYAFFVGDRCSAVCSTRLDAAMSTLSELLACEPDEKIIVRLVSRSAAIAAISKSATMRKAAQSA